MASVTATIHSIVIERGNDDLHSNAIGNLRRATVYLDNNSVTAVAGGTDTLDANLATAIQNSVLDGRTVTVRTVSLSQALATAAATFAGYMTLSSNTVSITPKSDGYLTGSTNATIPASTAIICPYGVYVSYTVA